MRIQQYALTAQKLLCAALTANLYIIPYGSKKGCWVFSFFLFFLLSQSSSSENYSIIQIKLGLEQNPDLPLIKWNICRKNIMWRIMVCWNLEATTMQVWKSSVTKDNSYHIPVILTSMEQKIRRLNWDIKAQVYIDINVYGVTQGETLWNVYVPLKEIKENEWICCLEF